MLLGIILDIYSQEYEEYHKNEKCFFSIGKKYEITYEFFLLNYRIDFKNSILSIYCSWWGKKENICLYTFIFSIYKFSAMFIDTFLLDQCELHAISGFSTFPNFFGMTSNFSRTGVSKSCFPPGFTRCPLTLNESVDPRNFRNIFSTLIATLKPRSKKDCSWFFDGSTRAKGKHLYQNFIPIGTSYYLKWKTINNWKLFPEC